MQPKPIIFQCDHDVDTLKHVFIDAGVSRQNLGSHSYISTVRGPRHREHESLAITAHASQSTRGCSQWS